MITSHQIKKNCFFFPVLFTDEADYTMVEVESDYKSFILIIPLFLVFAAFLMKIYLVPWYDNMRVSQRLISSSTARESHSSISSRLIMIDNRNNFRNMQ